MLQITSHSIDAKPGQKVYVLIHLNFIRDGAFTDIEIFQTVESASKRMKKIGDDASRKLTAILGERKSVFVKHLSNDGWNLIEYLNTHIDECVIFELTVPPGPGISTEIVDIFA